MRLRDRLRGARRSGPGASAVLGILLGVWLSPVLALGAGRPPIQNISSRAYGAAGARSWAVHQSRRGLLYVGGENGVHEYDGVSWQGVPVPNGTVRSLGEDVHGRILVGGVDELGYVDHDPEGRLRYVSLMDQVPEGDREFGDVWVIKVRPDGVFFQSWFRIFRWQAQPATPSSSEAPPFGREDLTIWKPDSAFGALCESKGRLFIQQQGVGLTELVGDRFELLPGGDIFAEADIVGDLDFVSNVVIRGPDEMVIVNIRRGLFLHDGRSIDPLRTDADDLLRTAYNNISVPLPDGSLAVGTYRAGLLLIDPSGHVRQIDRGNGLVDESIHGVARDESGGVWVAHKSGLSRVVVPSPVTWYDVRDGLDGPVNDIRRHEGRLYVATSEGVFALSGGRFHPVAGIASETNALLSAGGRLWSSSLHGVYEIRGRTAHRILSGRPLSQLLVSRLDPERAYLAVEDGVLELRLGESGWQEVARIPEIHTSVTDLVETKEGDLWVEPSQDGHLLRVRSGSNLVERYGPADGLPDSIASIHSFDGDFHVTGTNDSSYRFDAATRTFRSDVSLGARFGLMDGAVHLEQVEAGGSHVRVGMGTGDLHRQFVAKREADGSYSVHEVFTGTLDAAVWEEALMEPEGVTWFGGPDGLARYDAGVRPTTASPLPPLIRRVRAGGELRPLRPGLTDTSGVPALRLRYADNRLRFEFALPDFSAPSLNRYQVLLDGFDEEWSGWTAETRRDYTNLHEGRYRFRVRARNAHGRMSDETHYGLVIAPPWYRSLWAYAAYVLLLLTTGPSIYLVRVRQLRRRQRELEVLVAERTLELTEGNRRISEQARLLELLARTDPLTQLANRRSMQERLRLEAARVTRGAPSFSLVMADIDEFKKFNDRYGHDCGDFVLTSVGEAMQNQLREQDLLARWGGEEFLLLLADTSLDGGRRMAERLREAIVQTSFVYRGFSLSVRLSFGVVEFGRGGDAEACVAAADAAMYRAKVAGRDRIVVDQPNDDDPDPTEDLAN